ncbi:MAG: hypothetical protein ACREO3_06190 [Arenimonas sp.]
MSTASTDPAQADAAPAAALPARVLVKVNIPFLAIAGRLDVFDCDGTLRFAVRSRGVGSGSIAFQEPDMRSPSLHATGSQVGRLDIDYPLVGRGGGTLGVLHAHGNGNAESVVYKYDYTDGAGQRHRIDFIHGLRSKFILRRSNGAPWLVARQRDVILGKRWVVEAPNGIEDAEADALMPPLLLVVYLERALK